MADIPQVEKRLGNLEMRRKEKKEKCRKREC